MMLVEVIDKNFRREGSSMLELIIVFVIGTVVTLFLFWRKNSLKKDELTEQPEIKSFKLIEVLEAEKCYLVRIEIDGQEEWGEVPKNKSNLHWLGEQLAYQRFDIVDRTFYYVEKRWRWEDKKYYKVETTFDIFLTRITKVTTFSNKF